LVLSQKGIEEREGDPEFGNKENLIRVTNSAEKVQALGRKSRYEERDIKFEMRGMDRTILTLRCSFVPLEKYWIFFHILHLKATNEKEIKKKRKRSDNAEFLV